MYQNVTTYRRGPAPKKRRNLAKPLFVVVCVLIVLVGGSAAYAFNHESDTKTAVQSKTVEIAKKTAATPAKSVAAPDPCAGNSLSQLALVSISQRHMWACQGTTVVYDSPVVTGMENLPADLTPVGTYHIYAKETDLYLNGSDSTGSWHDFVNYWMPFLDNQYGAYGFHDATWRPANAFGNISPYSSNASHGCVELPLATAKWLYSWVSVGTTVTIES